MKRLSCSCNFFQSIESELGQFLNAPLIPLSKPEQSNLWLTPITLGKTPFPCPLLAGAITWSPCSSFMVQARHVTCCLRLIIQNLKWDHQLVSHQLLSNWGNHSSSDAHPPWSNLIHFSGPLLVVVPKLGQLVCVSTHFSSFTPIINWGSLKSCDFIKCHFMSCMSNR